MDTLPAGGFFSGSGATSETHEWWGEPCEKRNEEGGEEKGINMVNGLPVVDPLKVPELFDIQFFENVPEGDRDGAEVVFLDKDGNAFSDEAENELHTLVADRDIPKNGETFVSASKMRTSLFVSVKPHNGNMLDQEDLMVLGGTVARKLMTTKHENANIYWEKFPVECSQLAAVAAFMRGLQTPTYRFDCLKTKKLPKPALKRINIVGMHIGEELFSREEVEHARDFVSDLVRAQHLSRRWIDMPAQKGCMSTMDMVDLTGRIAEQDGVEQPRTPIIGDDLRKKGLHALWSVGKGRTDSPPALVTLKYQGAGEDDPWVALVGKCLVFDNGGENIKPTGGIEDMKADMGGAAMALATFDMFVRRNAKVNVILTLVIADNSISGESYHPGSVLAPYQGKSVEVGNTDAEGRLALADGIRWTEEYYKPDFLLTFATLTGAAVIALGNEFAALYGKTSEVLEALREASAASGDKAWPMPLTEARHVKVKESNVADHSNIGERWGGSISAAKFLHEVYCKTENSAHLDVAGVAIGGYDCTGTQHSGGSGGWGPSFIWTGVHELLGATYKGET